MVPIPSLPNGPVGSAPALLFTYEYCLPLEKKDVVVTACMYDVPLQTRPAHPSRIIGSCDFQAKLGTFGSIRALLMSQQLELSRETAHTPHTAFESQPCTSQCPRLQLESPQLPLRP